MVWACDEKRGALGRKEGYGNGSRGEKEERNTYEKTVGQSSVRPFYTEAYAIVHRHRVKVGII